MSNPMCVTELVEDPPDLLYGLEGQETLDLDPEGVIDRMLDDACYAPGEPFDKIAERISWPVKVYEYRRMRINMAERANLAGGMLCELLYRLDENYRDPDGNETKPMPEMQVAAIAFVNAVLKLYHVWTCEPTGKVEEFTLEQARALFGEDDNA